MSAFDADSTDDYDGGGMYQYREPGDVKLGVIVRFILGVVFGVAIGVLVLAAIASAAPPTGTTTLTIPVTGDVVRELQAATREISTCANGQCSRAPAARSPRAAASPRPVGARARGPASAGLFNRVKARIRGWR